MQLKGSEIKSLRSGRVDISESYAREEKNEIFLVNSHFAKYSNSSYLNHEEVRPRKLLLKKGDEGILKSNTQMGDRKYRIGSDSLKFYSKVSLKSGFKKIT